MYVLLFVMQIGDTNKHHEYVKREIHDAMRYFCIQSIKIAVSR